MTTVVAPITGASYARGRSKQDYSTPPEFMAAVKRRFGVSLFSWDLAASDENSKAAMWWTEQYDSLTKDWASLVGNLWLNPPFGKIEPWASKCARSCAVAHDRSNWRLFFLVPAAVGSNWHARHVDGKARVYLLNGRICFDGKNPFPKDLMLAVYGETPGYEVWRWR